MPMHSPIPIRLIPLFLCCSATASEFVISVTDAATLQPIAARVYVENSATGSRHFVRAHSKVDGVIYEKQNWANKRSIEHHTSVPAGPFVAENLPAGTYTLTVERGKEYFPETRSITLAEGEKRAIETVAMRRWAVRW